jgi:FAD synthetase
VIGDEILKGLVRDSNSYFLAQHLWQLGVKVNKISTIPDDIEAIAEEVRGFSSKYDFVLTSGGIGPTHDDVTVEGIAKAFDEELVHCKELEDLWPEATNFKSKFVAKMMRLPKSAKIQFGSDPSCPLVIVHNVHIYPGVPQYLKTMFVSNKSLYCNSDKRFYRMIALLRADELDMAEVLEEAQMKYNGQVSIGSYPILGNSLFTLKVTGESTCMKTLDKVCTYVCTHVHMYVCTYVHMYVYNTVCAYVRTCVYTYIHRCVCT